MKSLNIQTNIPTTTTTLKFKILMLGDSGVGKSSLVHRYANNDFSPNFLPTIGIDYKIKKLHIEDENGSRVLSLAIWDSAGQERFRNITRQYFRGAHGICLVFDISDRRSFENVHHWLDQVNQVVDIVETDLVLVLIGNKCDSTVIAVPDEEAQSLADACGIRYFKTSAKANINVTETFLAIALEIERNHRKRLMEKEKQISDEDSDERVRLIPSNDKPGIITTPSPTCCGAVSPQMKHTRATSLKL